MTSGADPSQSYLSSPKGLRRFSKLTCFATLFLIFVGGMVTSTGSGLAVPDWPLSYGTLFPPMVGGIFYEHSHRMVAATVGFLTLCLTIWLGMKEKRRWLRYLGVAALSAVVLQGILGGITVLFFLPTPISVMHAVLAQTFFILTIIIAYSLSLERQQKELKPDYAYPVFLRATLFLVILIYIQLILGALMRHTGSGLAIPDFPTMGGSWLPRFDAIMLNYINEWRFEHDWELVTMRQVVIHFLHRVGAVGIAVTVYVLNVIGWKYCSNNQRIVRTMVLLDVLVVAQIFLGIWTVLSQKHPHVTSLHVMTGAATLGVTVLLLLRAAPLSLSKFKNFILAKS